MHMYHNRMYHVGIDHAYIQTYITICTLTYIHIPYTIRASHPSLSISLSLSPLSLFFYYLLIFCIVGGSGKRKQAYGTHAHVRLDPLIERERKKKREIERDKRIEREIERDKR